MSQHDYDLADASGAPFRSDLNNVLAAAVSLNSGTDEPSTTFAYMLWADTTNGILKQRNAANTGWISLITMSTGLPVGETTKTAFVTTTHDISTATGSTAITGVGFTPKVAIMSATLTGGDAGRTTWVNSIFTSGRGKYQLQSSGYWSYGASGRIYSGASDYCDLGLSNAGSDGCDLDYSKSGSTTGTAQIDITFIG